MAAFQEKVDEGPDLQVVVGRQAILDERRRVAGYELLYRDSAQAASASVVDDVEATATVVLSAIADMGLASVVGERDVFLNCSAGVLGLELESLLPARQVVLEVLETVELTPELRARVGELRRAGFRIALDDYVPEDGRKPMLGEVDVVKVDLMQVPEERLGSLVADELSEFDGVLLAEKVEDEAQFQRCRELGFHLFQGYFFCRPNVVAQKASPEDRSSVIRILSEIQRPDITVDEAVALIGTDVSVTYRLLNCLNSVVFGMRHPVESLRQALVLLGMPRVRAWVSLMGMATARGKGTEVVHIALVRGSMAQTLSRSCQLGDPDTLFTVGLLSVLDAILDLDMSDVVEQLPLAAPIKAALVGASGLESDVLTSVLAYERGDFAEAVNGGRGITLDALGAAWLASVTWADATAEALLV